MRSCVEDASFTWYFEKGFGPFMNNKPNTCNKILLNENGKIIAAKANFIFLMYLIYFLKRQTGQNLY